MRYDNRAYIWAEHCLWWVTLPFIHYGELHNPWLEAATVLLWVVWMLVVGWIAVPPLLLLIFASLCIEIAKEGFVRQ